MTREPEKLETFAEVAEWMYEYAHIVAQRIVRSGREVRPIILVLSTDGSMDIAATAALSKDATAKLLNALAADPEVRCAAFVCEAWSASARSGSAAAKELDKVQDLQDFPGAEECVMMHFRGKDEERWAWCPIAEGRKSVERPPLQDPAGQAVGGRFFAPPKTKH